VVWALVSRSALWEQLPPTTHDLLCDQPLPYGQFFRWLDRLVLDQGPIERDALLSEMRQPSGDDSSGEPLFSPLADRIQQFHDLPDNQDTAENLIGLIRPLELDALREELNLLLQSGELSETAEARKLELLRQTQAMKLEISQRRPISS
jgi:DNA primase